MLDLTAAAPLAAMLLACRGAPLTLDGSAVDRLGAQCLQVLLAARAAWDGDGHGFRIVGASPGLVTALGALGAAGLLPTHDEAQA